MIRDLAGILTVGLFFQVVVMALTHSHTMGLFAGVMVSFMIFMGGK